MDLMSHSTNSLLRSRKDELYWQTFLLALGVSCVFFVPFIIRDQGYFLFYGDFNVQQVPFYRMCHEMVRSGNIFWNWKTDLGVNFIGSYSFYLLGSPFFWITLLFPTSVVPYLIGPLLMIKFACSALTAYMYIRRFVRRPQSAMLGGLLYAFSGFSVYNIFFNHFHEAIVFFPLLLLALELFITENRRGYLAAAVFICSAVNYFFFFGMAVFAVIYWFVRTTSGSWKITFKRFFAMVFEIAVGGLIACAILVPSYFAVIQNTRVNSILYGWNAILYGKEQIYLNIIECFFFPPDLPSRPVFFPGADVKWSSLGGWLPLISMTGVAAWLQFKRGHWLRRVICIMIFMAMVPILNSAFYMFNTAYYARWYFMPVLMMSLASVMALEDHSVAIEKSFKWVAGITVALTAVIGLFPASADENGKITRFGLFTDDGNEKFGTFFIRFWITCSIAVISLIVFRIILRQLKRNARAFYRAAVCGVCIVSAIYGFVFVFTGKQHSYEVKSVMIDQLLEGQVELPGDRDQYRIDVYSGVDNTGMYLGYDSINAFHSIVPGSVTEFYEFVGEERGVASRPTTNTYGIRSLLSVKYVLSRADGDSFEEYDEPKMPGYIKINDDLGGYTVYENENYIPYGFTYDYYMTAEQCDYYGESSRHLMLLKAILLDDKQIEKYSGVLKNIASDYIIGGDYDYDAVSITNPRESLELSYESFADDCNKRASSSASSFTRDNGGFTATITLDSPNLVFFSVPYEDGWSATVNGQPSEVEKVNAGFMAVLVPAGTNTIRFNYMTPGFTTGIALSISGIVILAAYLLIMRIWAKYKNQPVMAFNGSWPERLELEENWRKSDEIDREFVKQLNQKNAELDEEALEQAAAEEEMSARRSNMFEKASDQGGFTVDISVADTNDIDLNIESFRPETLTVDSETSDVKTEKPNGSGADKDE